MEKYTVIGCDEMTGQICCHHVTATDSSNAFAAAAALDNGLSMVVALQGWQKQGDELSFPGDSLVDGDTVLQQPEVFGEPATVPDNTLEVGGGELLRYRAGVDRTGYRSCTVFVTATSEEEGRKKALEIAGDQDFASEHSADYEVAFIEIDDAH